jgi:hypothetical protein
VASRALLSAARRRQFRYANAQILAARAGDRAYQTGPLEVWTKPLAGGDLAVGLFNRLRSRTEMRLNLSAAGWHGPAMARDLWAHQDIGEIREHYTVMVPAHGVVMLRLNDRTLKNGWPLSRGPELQFIEMVATKTMPSILREIALLRKLPATLVISTTLRVLVIGPWRNQLQP